VISTALDLPDLLCEPPDPVYSGGGCGYPQTANQKQRLRLLWPSPGALYGGIPTIWSRDSTFAPGEASHATCAVCGNAFFTTRAGVTPLAELSHNPVPFDDIGLERSTVALLGRVTHQALIPSVAFSVCLYTATEKGVSHSGTTCIQAGCGMQTSEGASTLLEHLLRVTSPPLYERRLLPRFYPSLNGLIRKLLNLLASPRGFEPLLPP
jgi:hypothetical protein